MVLCRVCLAPPLRSEEGDVGEVVGWPGGRRFSGEVAGAQQVCAQSWCRLCTASTALVALAVGRSDKRRATGSGEPLRAARHGGRRSGLGGAAYGVVSPRGVAGPW